MCFERAGYLDVTAPINSLKVPMPVLRPNPAITRRKETVFYGQTNDPKDDDYSVSF